MHKYLRILVPVLLLLVASVNAPASVITGYATDGTDDNQIGAYSGDDILYYIPISPGDTQTYGVDNGGMTVDTFDKTSSNQISGALLDMYLYFLIPENEKGTSLLLRFTDLDLEPYNDPNHFFESLSLNGEGGLPNDTYMDFGDIPATVTNNDSPTNNDISVDFAGLNFDSGDLWLHLQFQATSDIYLQSGTWKNTQEALYARVTTTEVPEPASLVLMAIGLLGLFSLRRVQLKPVRIRDRKRRR